MPQSPVSPLRDSAVVTRDDVLAALIAPRGPHPDRSALLAFLKLAPGAARTIQRSELELLDAAGRALQTRCNAFGLPRETRIAGPASRELTDDTPRPAGAARARWRVDDIALEVSLVSSEAEWAVPRVVYLPLQVPVVDDPHLLVTVVNTGAEMMNIADAVRTAVCWVDGVPYESAAGRVWNGGYLVRPMHVRTRRFRLADFPGAPQQGTRRMMLDLLGARSAEEIVEWRGNPGPPGNA